MNNEILKKIAKNSGDDLIKWFQSDLAKLQQPDQIPDDDISSVKAYKMHLYWLQDKITLITKLQKPDTIPDEDSYE